MPVIEFGIILVEASSFIAELCSSTDWLAGWLVESLK
jgi:hypothetical protein